jgi:RNA polymerase sigma-70 factor (ECF subfamily)
VSRRRDVSALSLCMGQAAPSLALLWAKVPDEQRYSFREWQGSRQERVRVARARSIWSNSEVAAPSRPATGAPPASDAPGADPVASDNVDAFIRAYSPYVARLAYRLLGRDEEVDDVVQDVFVAFLRFRQDIREPAAVRSWLATTTVRTVHKRLRTRMRRLRALLRLEGDNTKTEALAVGASPEDHTALARVHRALDGVPAKVRIAWVLRYLEQETNEDVARLCRCSLATAKRRIAQANLAVQKAIGQ